MTPEEKIAITFDSGLTIPEEYFKNHHPDIQVQRLPVIININNEEKLDTGSVTPSDMTKVFKETGNLPTTMPPSMQDHFRFFTRMVHMGYTVIHFSTSAKLSFSYDNAIAASESFAKVHVIDSKTYSIGAAPLITKAIKMAENKQPAQEIIKQCNEIIDRLRMFIAIGDIEFIHSVGRINIAQKWILNLFKQKPTIEIEDGYFTIKKRYKGDMLTATEKFATDICKQERLNADICYIGYTDAQKDVAISTAKIIKAFSNTKETCLVPYGASVAPHYGDSSIFISWTD